jgi:DNA-binding NtrC family response regulator
MPLKRCLVLEMNVCVGHQIASLLEEEYGWRIYVVHSGTQAYARLLKTRIDVVVANIDTHDLGGLAFLTFCHQHYPWITTYGIAPSDDPYRKKLACDMGGCKEFFYLVDNSMMIDFERGMGADLVAKQDKRQAQRL